VNTYMKKLHAAINAHDLDAIEACFATDYRNETPRTRLGASSAPPRCGPTGR